MQGKHRILRKLNSLSKKPLWFRLTGILILIVLVLGIAILLVISQMYQSRIEAEYVSKGVAIARMAAGLVDGATVDRYLETLKKDEIYAVMLRQLRTLQKENGIRFIYIARIVKGGAIFVFDTDEEAPVELGEFDEWSDSYNIVANKLIQGERVDPVELDVKWGWLLVTYEPILRADGSVAAYAGVDISMDQIVKERRNAFISTSLAILLVLTASVIIYLYVIHKIVIAPIDALVNNISMYMPMISGRTTYAPVLSGTTEAPARNTSRFSLRSNNELKLLQRAIVEMKWRINNTIAEREQAEELTQIMLDTMPLCCQIWDKNFHTIECNEAAVRLFGIRNKQEYIDRFFELSPEYQADGQRSDEKVVQYVKKAFDEGSFVSGWMHQMPDGTPVPSEVTLVRVRRRNDYVVVAYIRDLRNIRAMEDNIRWLKVEVNKAYYDGLTGINNRRFFDENLKHIIKSLSRSGAMLSLMMIDIDYFKKYNDTYGHIKGDTCLKAVAESLAKSITRADDFVARYGGEEFVVVLQHTGENGARTMAVRFLENIRKCNIPHEQSDVANIVTISIGVCTGKVEYTHTEDEYIKSADEMLYKSKQGGRNRFNWTSLTGKQGLENQS